MTRDAIEKIEKMPRVKKTIEAYSILICRCRKIGLESDSKYKLKGYLQALEDTGIISGVEARALLLYYSNKDWKEED